MTVNKPHGEAPTTLDPRDKLPQVNLTTDAPSGSRQRLLTLGAEGFARAYGSLGEWGDEESGGRA